MTTTTASTTTTSTTTTTTTTTVTTTTTSTTTTTTTTVERCDPNDYFEFPKEENNPPRPETCPASAISRRRTKKDGGSTGNCRRRTGATSLPDDMGCYCPKYMPYSKQGTDDTPVVNMLGKVYEAARKADPCAKWETYPGRCTSRPGGNEYELGHWFNADLPYEDVHTLCAEACAAEKSGHCTGFDVMLQYGYEEFSQCRIYGKKSNLVNVPGGYRWNQEVHTLCAE